jgi:hypothetical protein
VLQGKPMGTERTLCGPMIGSDRVFSMIGSDLSFCNPALSLPDLLHRRWGLCYNFILCFTPCIGFEKKRRGHCFFLLFLVRLILSPIETEPLSTRQNVYYCLRHFFLLPHSHRCPLLILLRSHCCYGIFIDFFRFFSSVVMSGALE